MQNKQLVRIGLIAGAVFILIIAFSSSIFVTVGSGERGVKYEPLSGGLDKDKVYKQGLKVKAPWNTMIVYEIRKQENRQSMEVLSSNGLDINIDVSIRYNPIGKKIGYLHDQVGINYLNKIIIPEVRSSTREVIGQYKPEELYSKDRAKIQRNIKGKAAAVLEKNYIKLNALLIRSIELPSQIKQAIERKLTEQQEIQQKENSKQKAKKEAERREIEARGKSKANDILDKSLTDKVLQDKAIEATGEVANSENSKVIMIGNGKDDLPVILSADK
ncbi:MAG: peptidase [Bacteroidetes bacterium SW_10_40_5]|nr:MAG: peptidase [Bacteroidetes bacterium SW_10_40_5]